MKKDSRRLPPAREVELSELAEAVAQGADGIINPLAIAAAHRITTSFGDYGDAFDGLLESKAGAFHIYCNRSRLDSQDSPRARFTLAHELGHYFIDEHRNALLAGLAPSHPSVCDYESANLIEVEADCFASSLLMPTLRFRAAAKNSTRGLAGILDLCSSFRTSILATAIRYLQMDFFPCVIVKWSPQGYSWKRLSQSAYIARLRKTIQDPGKLPPDSPTARVLTGSGSGLIEAGTTKATWFPFVSHSSDDNAIFHEQAISLGRYGAVTFLYPN